MTGNFILCGTPKEWVGLGVFGLVFFSPFSILVEGGASEKYVQLAYTFGKLSGVVLPICHKPEPSRHQLQEKAGCSISVTDFIQGFSFGVCQEVPDVMRWFSGRKLPVRWEQQETPGLGHPQLTDGSVFGHWWCWQDSTQLRRERNHNVP